MATSARAATNAALSASMSSGNPAWLSSMPRNHKRRDLARAFCKPTPIFCKLSGALRPPRMLRVTPVDRLQQIAHLRSRQRDDAVHRHRPDKASTVHPFRVKRQSNSVMPQCLDQRAAPATEHEDISGERITTKAFLHQQCQTLHALAHVGEAGRNPDARA